MNLLKKIYYSIKYKNDEWFDILDEKGNTTGKAPRTICHNGSMLLHPVIHIHIINSKGELLLQKRSKNKKIQPGKWDTSVGGHIDSGETLIEALKREAREELGINININDLIFLRQYNHKSQIEHEMVFSYSYKYDGKINFGVDEIDEVKFFTHDEIRKLKSQEKTTPNFNDEFDFLHSIL